jgi:hypothetical protein
MSKVHGRHTAFKLNAVDLSTFCNNSQLKFSGASHDTTTYGKDWNVFSGGLLTGTMTVSGFYDSTAMTGPRAVIRPLLGTVVPFVHMPEGEGGGLPQDAGDCLVTDYQQTHPVADMVTWEITLQFSDEISADPQEV